MSTEDDENEGPAVAALKARINELEIALADIALRKESLTTGYNDTFDQAGVGMALVSPTGAFLDANAHFCKMLGMSLEQLEATTFQAITYEPDLSKNLDALQSLLRGEIPGYRMEKRYLRSNGEIIWVDLTVSAHRGPDGKPTRMISIISDITEKKAAEERQDFLLGELHHRTKNLIAVVQAIVNQAAAKADSVDALKNAVMRRLASMSASQDALVVNDGRQATVRGLVEGQLAIILAPDDPRIVLSGPHLLLGADATRMLGMTLYELVTNACKYGALSLPTGGVDIRWAVESSGTGSFVMSWVEHGGPDVAPPTRVGFGRRVIERLAASATSGKVDLVFKPTGVEWHFASPLSIIAQEAGGRGG